MQPLRETIGHPPASLVRDLLENLPVPLLLEQLGPEPRPLYVSPALRRLLGFSLEEWSDPAFFQRQVHPEDLARVLRARLEPRRGRGFEIEFRLFDGEGVPRRLYQIGRDIARGESEPLLRESVLLDISERRHVEKDLRERSERLDLVLEQLPTFIWTTDEELRFTFARGAALADLGVTPADVVGRRADEYFPGPEPRDTIVAAYRRALAGEEVDYETHYLGRDYEAHARPLRDRRGKITGVLGIAHDLTALRIATKEQRESEERYRHLFESSRDALLVFRVEPDGQPGRFLEISPAACRLLGYSHDELLQLGPLDITEDWLPDEFTAFLEEARTGTVGLVDRILITRDGRRVPVEVNPQPFDLQGPAILAMVRDVSARRALEEQVRHLQKMETMGQLAGSIAHDFNNQLTGIVGFVTFAREGLPPDSVARRSLDDVLTISRQAANLTKQLLAFSRKQSLAPELLDVNDQVREAAASLRQILSGRVELGVDLSPEIGLVLVDPGQLYQILLNLAINARDAIEELGHLTIATRAVRLEHAPVDTPPGHVSGEFVSLEVRDTGPGIPDNIRPRIFEPFFTTKPAGKGTGLGLATCYGIVTQSAGHIHVESRLGEGTTFRIYFPVAS